MGWWPNGAGKTTTLHGASRFPPGPDPGGRPRPCRGSGAHLVPDEPTSSNTSVEEHSASWRGFIVVDVDEVPGNTGDGAGGPARRASGGTLPRHEAKAGIVAPSFTIRRPPPGPRPTGLDPVGIRRMKATILDPFAAVILSSHPLHLVEETCTRVLMGWRWARARLRHHRRDRRGTARHLAVSQAGRGVPSGWSAITLGRGRNRSSGLLPCTIRSTRNRLAPQLRRLRTPRYALALVMGLAYLGQASASDSGLRGGPRTLGPRR